MYETLTIGSGQLGVFAATHFFNSLDESVARYYSGDETYEGYTELTGLSAGLMYTEREGGKLEPRLLLLDEESKLSKFPASTMKEDSLVSSAGADEESAVFVHPYQKWNAERVDRAPAEGFHLADTATKYLDFCDAGAYASNSLCKTRLLRPRGENEEVIDDGLRHQFEAAGSLEVLDLVELPWSLMEEEPSPWHALQWVLDESPKAATAVIVSPGNLPEALVTAAAQSSSAEESSMVETYFARCKVTAAQQFMKAVELVDNKTGKVILPLFMDAAVETGVSMLRGSTSRLAGWKGLRRLNLFDRSSLVASAADSLTLPYRLPRRSIQTAYDLYTALRPPWSCLAVAAVGHSATISRTGISVTTPASQGFFDWSGLHSQATATAMTVGFWRQQRIGGDQQTALKLAEQQCNRRLGFWRSIDRAINRVELATELPLVVTNAAPQSVVSMPEPLALSCSHALRDNGGSATHRGEALASSFLFVAAAVGRGSIEYLSSTDGAKARKPAGFLEESVEWLREAERNSCVVGRGEREDTRELRDSILDLCEHHGWAGNDLD